MTYFAVGMAKASAIAQSPIMSAKERQMEIYMTFKDMSRLEWV
jgi:hypothetical protein